MHLFVYIYVRIGGEGEEVGEGGYTGKLLVGLRNRTFGLRRKFRGQRLRIHGRSLGLTSCVCVLFALTICSTLNCPVKYPCWLSLSWRTSCECKLNSLSFSLSSAHTYLLLTTIGWKTVVHSLIFFLKLCKSWVQSPAKR